MAAIRLVRQRLTAATILAAILLSACGGEDATSAPSEDEPSEPLTVYSGRSEELVGSVFEAFTEETGIDVNVRYGNTAELAVTIIEEGPASPADLYWGQDAGALGALEAEGRFRTLSDDILDLVDANFRAPTGAWTGVTGRVRVISYNTDVLDEADVPTSVFELTDPVWSGRVGWAPENGSFQAFVTAMRLVHGDDVTRQWLDDMVANDVVAFGNNTGAIEGVSRGEVDLALVNHYYVYRMLAENPAFNVANKYLPGDIGGLMNVAGIGVLDSSDQPTAAAELIRFLLSESTQEYFGQVTDALEFPLRAGVDADGLPDLASLAPPEVDLSRLDDLQVTLSMLQDVGAFN